MIGPVTLLVLAVLAVLFARHERKRLRVWWAVDDPSGKAVGDFRGFPVIVSNLVPDDQIFLLSEQAYLGPPDGRYAVKITVSAANWAKLEGTAP
jgi:hypothetical protein